MYSAFPAIPAVLVPPPPPPPPPPEGETSSSELSDDRSESSMDEGDRDLRRRPGRFDEEGRGAFAFVFPVIVVVGIERLGADDDGGPTRAVMRIGMEGSAAGVLDCNSSLLLKRCFCHLAK